MRTLSPGVKAFSHFLKTNRVSATFFRFFFFCLAWNRAEPVEFIKQDFWIRRCVCSQIQEGEKSRESISLVTQNCGITLAPYINVKFRIIECYNGELPILISVLVGTRASEASPTVYIRYVPWKTPCAFQRLVFRSFLTLDLATSFFLYFALIHFFLLHFTTSNAKCTFIPQQRTKNSCYDRSILFPERQSTRKKCDSYFLGWWCMVQGQDSCF